MLIERRTMKRIATMIVASVVTLMSFASHAVTVNDLYEVTMPIDGNREAAFVEALKAVAVRVSGRRDAASQLGSAANSPRQFVQRFAFTTDNQLQVAFHPSSVDRLLSESGLPTWGRERPATLVLLNLPGSDGASMWVEAAYPAAEKEALTRAAKQRGVPLVWPTLSSQERGELGSVNSASLLQLAARHGANAVLVGEARRDGAGVAVRWSLTSEDGLAQASGSLEDGAHLVADTFGRIFSAAAGALGSMSVEVSGVNSLDDYATTVNYFEAMTLVRSVALERVIGDTMRFQLGVRGDATTLRRALALDNKLVPVGPDGDIGSAAPLQLRLSN
jgi:uncharacterized protein